MLAPLRASGEGLAAILMQVFFASVGASGSIATVMQTAPTLFLWSAIAVSSARAGRVWGRLQRAQAGARRFCYRRRFNEALVWHLLPAAAPRPVAAPPALCPTPILALMQRTWRSCWRVSGCWASRAKSLRWPPMPTSAVRCTVHCAAPPLNCGAVPGRLRGTRGNMQALCCRRSQPPCLACTPRRCTAGPTTAAGMAAAKGWRRSLVPALLIGITGYASATFIGVAAAGVFRSMQAAALAG